MNLKEFELSFLIANIEQTLVRKEEIEATKKKTIKDIDVNGKRVLLRVDFNVPIDDNGII